MLSASSSLSPVFQPNISLYQAFFAFFVGFFLQPVVMAIRLHLRYPQVPGTYSVEREYSDGKVEPREGTIQIRRNWWRGSFSVTAFHAPNKRQWQGEMHLSLDMTKLGMVSSGMLMRQMVQVTRSSDTSRGRVSFECKGRL
jgi:hypothetical protein